MSWTLLAGLVAAIVIATLLSLQRRRELQRMARTVDEVARARASGTDQADLKHPHIDLTRCLGCAACLRACPEQTVLDLVHGHAVVVHGAHCVGHGLCQEACPSGAISVHVAGLDQRRDLPALGPSLEAVGVLGLYLAGEVTGHGLIRSAVEQGREVARTVHRRHRPGASDGGDSDCDLLVIGAGPAGLACALEAQGRGLAVEVLEQEAFGGSVAHFPRRKLVLTRPVDFPGYGALDRETYTREELLGIWEDLAAEHRLPIHDRVRFSGLARNGRGAWRVDTDRGPWHARSVCLAVGRRGSPRRLDAPGAELPKVQTNLLDARALRGRGVLVVGGGDSAVEAALAVGLQPEARVTLCYRGAELTRPHERNLAALEDAVREGRVELRLESHLRRIEEDAVLLEHDGATERLPNDDVFLLLGGTTPVELLERCGVSLDPRERELHGPPAVDVRQAERKRLIGSLGVALALALATGAWVLAHLDYYALPISRRPLAPDHDWLRPSAGAGLAFGILAALMVLANLAYLLRREPWFPLRIGRQRDWLTVHIVTGILALLAALLHGGMRLGDTLGGHAGLALALLVATGAVGRYLYAFVPRAASGRDLAHDEVRAELERVFAELEEHDPTFARRGRAAVEELVEEAHWRGGFLRRFVALVGARRRARRALDALGDQARGAGRGEDQVRELLWLVSRAETSARAAAWLEDLRAMLSGWRHLHGWLALLLVLIIAAHVFDALRYGGLFGG